MICINKNLNSYKILSNVFSEAEIAQLYIDNKYALPTDEESYQLVKAFSDKPTQIKEGVAELFESNPELANAVYEVLGFEIPTTKLQGKKKDSQGKIITFDVIEELTSNERKDLPESILLKKLFDGKYIPKTENGDILLGSQYRMGSFSPGSNLIQVKGANKDIVSKILNHELLHAVTTNIIRNYQVYAGEITLDDLEKDVKYKKVNLTENQIKALNELTRLKSKVITYYKNNSENIQDKYPDFGKSDYFIRTQFTKADLNEFISEVFSNPNLIEVLKQIPSEGKKSNLFKDFVDAIAKILGFTNTSILEDIVAYSEEAFFAQPQITPQQKQQALQLYSQYLDTAKTNVILPTDRIVFGHPTIGKSFLKNQGEDKFISLDDDYATEINNKVKEIADKYNVTTYQVKDGGTQSWNNEYNQMMQEMFNVAKQKAISENKTLFTSNTNLLRNNAESFDKVINLTDKEFERRIQERGAKYDTKEWKSQINETISKLPANKIINTNKYLSDLFLGSKQDIAGFKDFVSKESSVEDMPTTPALDYNFKALDIINKNINKISSWEKNKSINEDTLYKKIGELGVPKEQLELIRQSKGDNIAEKLSSFIAEYSYAVEVNTAKRQSGYNNNNIPFTYKKLDENHYVIIDPSGTEIQDVNTKTEAEDRIAKLTKELKEEIEKPTDYYSNLTVPGGTNYTEQEIATPAITPNIKGHAQFATDKGIGWFRSDEQKEYKGELFILNDYFYQSDGKTYNIEHEDSGGGESKSITKEEYEKARENKNTKFINQRVIKNTRRILEVQSDLFQKGRDEEQLIGIDFDLQGVGYTFGSRRQYQIIDEFNNEITFKDTETGEVYNKSKEWLKEQNKKVQLNKPENQFLQLLNKNNNWVTFFVKSIIQDSAKKGYEKVLFPRLDTIIQIESQHRFKTYAEAEAHYKNEKWKLEDEELRKTLKEYQEEFENRKIAKKDTKEIEQAIINQKERIRSHQPTLLNTANFYEYELANRLDDIAGGNKNNRAKGIWALNQITDEYGNTWNEITIETKRDVTPVALSPKVLTELQESKLKEFIDKEDSFIKTIGVERTEQLVTYTFEKVVSSIEQGNGARAGFNSVLNVLQERLDELQEVSDNREEYELDEDYIQVLENTIKATKDTIDNFNVIVNRVNFELENTKGLVEDEDNSEDNGGDAKGERYNLEAYEIDPIIGISSKLKLFLSGIKAISPKAVSIARAQYKQRLMDENNELPEQDRKTEEEIDSIVNQLDENLLFDTIADESDLYDKTWFLQDALMPFRNVHKQLLVELAGVEESYEAVIAKLRQSAKEKYWINQVIDKLEKADTQTKNQFVSEMPKHNLSMEFVQLSKKYVEVNGKKISFYTTYVRKSNSNEVSQLVLENWKNDFISSDMVTPEVDDYVFNVDNVRELSEDMGNILSEVASKPKVKVLKGKVSTKEIFYKNLQNSITYAEEINVIRNSNAKPAVNIGTEGNVNTYIINEDGSLELYENDFGNLATKVQNLYKRVGISLSDNTVNYLIKNSTGTSYLDELSNVIDYISENIDARLFEDNTDPINQSSIKTLAALESRLNPNPNIMPTSFRTQGKDVFAFTAKNFLNDRAKALLTQELLNNLKRTPFAKDSKYIPIIEKYLNGTASVQEVKVVEAMGIIEDLDLQVIKNLERVIAYGDKRFTRIDEIEQELVSLGLFVNSNTKPVDGKRIARYVFPTFSDKTRSAVVGMEAEEYSYDYENKTVTDETVDRVFKSTVEAELKRIINYHAKGHSTSNNEQYAMGGGFFFFFPTMNGIMIQTETGVENIHNAIKFQVTQMGEFNKGVKEYEETSLSEGIVEAIKQELKTQLNSQIDAKVDVWNEYELLKFVTENNVTSLKEAGFDYKYLTKFNKNNNFKNEADIERALRLFAADYKINDIVAKAEMHKLYLGDPAMMFKKSKNHSEIVKRMTLNDQLSAEDLLNLVKEAQTNIGKRLALEIATGKKSAENASKNYIQLMAKDPVVKSATLSYLSRVLDGKVFDLDNYAKLDDDGKKAYIAQFPNTSTFIDIDGADAQELTTLKEYLTTDIDFGKTDITLEEIDEILAIEEKDNITTEEFEKLSSFLNKITTQPQKPVYSGDMYDPDTETMRVVYIKTSAFPLSKHFTKDFQIDNLRKAMIKLEKETGLNVRMSYSTGNKLGAVTKANALTIFDNEGNVLSEEDIYDSINNEISIVDGKRKLTPRSFNQLPYLVLPRKNFRIQQENPLKRKSTIKGGSQERKLLWMDLLTLNNPEINKLYGEYMDLYESLYQEEFDKLMSEITTTNAEGEKVLSITKASELLLKEAKSRNYPIQDIRGLNIVKGNFAIPLMFHGSSERYESLINSIINNRLANIQMPGHSYILGSSEGFKVREVSEKYPIPAGTIFVKEGITDLKNSHFVELVKDENGNVIDRIPITKKIESYAKGEIEFVPAQVIVPNTIYVEIDGKKEKIYLEEFVFTKDNKKYLDVSRFNPDLLKVFGFRIPTSGQMSMATMEIVGFMPENQGDLLLAPRDFTKQMGSDFDVDKLYTYNYEVEAYFDENGKPEYRKKDSKRNRIIEIHHNLLSLANTNVQRKVLSPLSFDIAKEQADLIESSKGYVPSILDDEYQKMKRIGGAAGKSGTGKYSLAITLHSSLQQAAFNRTKQEYIESELLQIGTYTQEGDFIPFRMTIAGLKFDGKLGKSNTLSLTGESSRDISDVLAQRQNYSLDNEKEQLMFRLNDNKYTMPFNMFMDLAGFDLVTVNDNNNGTVNISITDFLRTQPVILEYVKLRNLGKTEIEAFEELDKKYPFSEDFAFEAESASFAQQLFNGTANQSAVLNIFKSASEEGAKLGSLSSAYNTDSSGLGKSIFDVIDKENKIVNLYNSFYNIGNFNANTINGIVTNQALQASEMFEAIMPYRNLSFVLFNKVKAITGNDLNVDDMQDVFREFKKHIFASHLIKNFDDSAGSITDIRREMFFHTEENESFANYAKYVQQITPMALLNGMTFEINTNDLPSVITWNNSIKSDNETRFYTDFLAMFTNKTALRPYNGKPMTYQKFAQMLVTYAYLEGGIQGGYQYIKYVPVEYLQATGMAEALTNVQNYVKTVKPFDEDKIAEIVNDNFFVQLVQHNPSLVKNKINLSEFFGKVIGANAKEFKNVTEFSTKEKEKPRFFRVYNYQSDVKNRRIRKKEAEVLFIYDENTNKYYRIPSKGIYGMSEYDYMSNEIRSLVNAYNKNTVLDNNKALIEETKAESEFKLSKVSTVKDLLDFVSKSNNEFNRTIAQSLKGIADNVPVTIDNSIDSAGLATPNSIILRKDYMESLLKMNKFSEIEAVILEEVLHTVTIDYLRNPENHTEDIQRKVASIKKLYTKAFDKALEKKLFTLSEMEMIKKSYETAITPEQKVAYSLMDEYEFVARIISEPNTREALSKIKSGNKTYLERILDEISELINSVLKMLGISNDTITAEGIEATLDLVSAIKAQKVKDAKDTIDIKEATEYEYSFTYKGKTIETRFQLSDDQNQALETLIDFIDNYDRGQTEQNSRIVLQGAAGTGKTAIIGYLSKYIGKGFLYMAPTHAATAELGFATVETGNKKMPLTVASALREDKYGVFDLSLKARRKNPLGNRVIVVDEVSLLSNSDYNKLLDLEKKGYQIIFIGDRKQLPEVIEGANNSKNISRAFTENPSVELNIIHRTSIPELKSLLQKIRNSVIFKLFKPKRNTENVQFFNSGLKFDEVMANVFKKNPLNTVYIGYTNKSVTDVNKKIREDVFGRSGVVQKNDIVVGYLGYASKQIEEGNIANSLIYKVEKVTKTDRGYDIIATSERLEKLRKKGMDVPPVYSTIYLPLGKNEAFESEFEDYVYENNNNEIASKFDQLHTFLLKAKKTNRWGDYLTQQEIISDYFKRINLGEDYIYNVNTKRMEVYNKNSPSQEHLELKEYYGSQISKFYVEKGIDYGHAITIHKSQGATIDNVFFDANTLRKDSDTVIKKNGENVTTERQALSYVAMSRASKNLYVNEGWVSFEEIDNDVVQPTQFNSEEKIIKGEKVKEGIYVNQEALTKEEQLELFNYLKPYLESQAAKTNKSPNASKMIGLGLRWDYKSNNPNKSPIYIEDVINPANRTKYGYYNTSINGEDLAQITPRFRELFQKATNVDMTNYDAAIINLYDNDSFISTHNDVDESNSAINYPVIGINLGGSGNFSIESKENPMQLKLKAGTAYVFGVNGVNRKVFHRTFPGKQDSFLPELTTKLDNKTYPAGSYRVTITMRRVMPLTEGMTESPFKFTQPTTQETTSTTQPVTTESKTEVTYQPKGKERMTYTVVGGKTIYNRKGDIVFKEDSVDRNKILANAAVKEGRAVVVNYKDTLYVVNNKNVIISGQTGAVMKWDENNGNRKAIIALAEAKREKPTVTETSNNPLILAGVKPTDMKGNASKDIQMAEEATQFIGFQSGNATVSSTNKYRLAWGDKANTGNYSIKDTIMVSGSGTWRGVTESQIKETLTNKYKPLLEKAIAAKASFLVGNQYEKGNLSDELVAKYLKSKGYAEEKFDGYSKWVWEKSEYFSPIVKPKTVSVSGLPTIIVDENKQSRCK